MSLYNRVFEAEDAAPIKRTRKQQKSYDIGKTHGKLGATPGPHGVPYPVHYEAGYREGTALKRQRERPRAPVTTRSPATSTALQQTGGRHPIGRMGGEIPPKYSEERRRFRDPRWMPSLATAVQGSIRQAIQRGHRVGERMGAGAHGHVHHGPTTDDGGPSVYKFELGDDEARLAGHYLRDEGIRSLRSLPKYHSVTNYGVRHSVSGKTISMIHREGLADADTHPAVGHAVRLGAKLGLLGRKLQDYEAGDHHELAKSALQHIDHAEERAAQELSDSKAHGHFKQFTADMRSMVKAGIYPCDLERQNFGVRHATGELVIRDAGCYGLSPRDG